MKKRTIYIGLCLIFIIGLISLIGTFAIDSSITEGNSTKADYLFNITLGDRTNREIVIPSYDSKIVDIKISNPNEFNMAYLLYLEGVNSNLSIINISNTESSGVLNSKTNTLIKVFIQNNSSSDITTSIKDIVGFENEKLSVPSNNTSINKGTYYKVIVKSNNNDYGKVKPNIKLSTNGGIVKYTLEPKTGYKYKSNTCNGTVSNNILTIPNITSNTTCEVVFVLKEITVNFDLAGGVVETTYTESKEHTYTVPYTGTYKLETWGAQGGDSGSYTGGYGGYSVGTVNLNKDSKLYINVGGQGKDMNEALTYSGGYNGGGGRVYATLSFGGEGGGATHIATTSGLLSTLSSLTDKILIVSGGGGGGKRYGDSTGNYTGIGGSGGGYIGNAGIPTNSTVYGYGLGGSQTSGGGAQVVLSSNGLSYGSFGQGAIVNTAYEDRYLVGAGGGGGYYGGGSIEHGPAGGGSGYIGNSQLTDKYMYCYNCSTSDTTDTKTYTTTNVSSMPISDYAKSGNGAARITLLSNFSNTKTYGTKYSNLPTPTRTGYTFDGWYTGENGTGTKVTSDTILKNTNNHTLYAKWIKDVNVIYDGNIFVPSSNYKVSNGLTITYDPNTSYLTINGTPTSSSTSLGIMYGLSFAEGEKYASKATYISGSYSNAGSDGGCFALDVKNSSGVEVSTRNYADLGFTTSNGETILTINSAAASDGDRFEYWLYFGTPSNWTFTNYTVKIDLTKIESKTIQYGQKYGTLPTLTKAGYTFNGWYTGENGTGTKITSDTALTNASNHTLYASWSVNTYYLDLNGYLNGSVSGYLTGYGTADIYINGALVCDDCTDYYSEHPYGTAYSISDIKTTAGHTYNGVYSGSTSGTITGTTGVYLSFSTSYYTISFDIGGEIATLYTDSKENIFTVPYSGTYRLEVWGAQAGGKTGGYGGYSIGYVHQTANNKLYAVVGGTGDGFGRGSKNGGYNGGGSAYGTSHNDGTDYFGSGGGGATHIATVSGLLSSVKSSPQNVLIAAGGGGGGIYLGWIS